jgi:hypothetical protein
MQLTRKPRKAFHDNFKGAESRHLANVSNVKVCDEAAPADVQLKQLHSSASRTTRQFV